MEGTETKSVQERMAAYLAPEPEPAPEPETEAEESEEPTVEREAAPEAESEPEAPAEAAEEVEEVEEPEGTEITSLADLREILDVDEADLYNLSITASIGGKPQEVTLSELKDAFVGSREATRMREEAKQAREEARQEAQKAQERYQQQLAQGAALVDNLEKSALAQFEGINWNELRSADPAEWSAKRSEYEQARQHIEQVKTRVQQQIGQHHQQMQAQQQEALEAHLAKEREALMSAWPELGNDESGERDALVKELKGRGFSEQEIGNASDHRLLLMARDAMRWRAQAQKADVARKKVVKIGKKVVKPGARQSRAEQRQDAIRPLRDRLRKSGSIRDAAALLSESSKQR